MSIYDYYGIIIFSFIYVCLIAMYVGFRIKNKKGNVTLKERHIVPLITAKVEDTPIDMVGDAESALSYADDEEMIIDRRFTFKLGVFLGGGIVISFIGIMFEEANFAGVYMAILPLSCGLLALYFFMSNPTDVFVFNRKTGMLTYPNGFMRKRTVPFQEATFIRGQVSSGMEYIGIMHKNGTTWTSISGGFKDMEEFWSFLVWYMDRNRPLPPGSAFNSYRQQDFKRRQEEGFPSPLFPSEILMEDVDGNRTRYPKSKRKYGLI